MMEGQENKFTFERNELNPLETDVLIIDEMSMLTFP
jgi:ATP-dependent exoDNAse (exonuclease V) alpha subunit